MRIRFVYDPHGGGSFLRDFYAGSGIVHPDGYVTPDGKPVSMLFALLMPDRETHSHLQLLAGIAEMSCDPHLREQLGVAASVAQVRALRLSPCGTAHAASSPQR